MEVVVHNYQHFHKRTNTTLGGGVNSNVHFFLEIINVDRTFHCETNFVEKVITTINYKKGLENSHECFLRIIFFYDKINIFGCTLW